MDIHVVYSKTENGIKKSLKIFTEIKNLECKYIINSDLNDNKKIN